jgi:Zn-dependent protease with chaperone function
VFELGTIDEKIAVWQKDADDLHEPIRWLPFWRPRIVVKRGRFSPWFWPYLWLAKSGAFNLFSLVIVSDDLLNCPATHRRAIIAHECGHLSRLHFLIWTVAATVVLKNDVIRFGFAWIGTHIGVWVELTAFFVVIILSIFGGRALLNWFEYQADDYAVERVGPQALVSALSWLRTTLFRNKGAPWVEARIRRLNSLHNVTQ